MSDFHLPSHSTLSSSFAVQKPKSSLQISRDSPKEPVQYTIFYWKEDGVLIEIKLPDTVSTIQELIEQSIAKIMQTHNLLMPDSSDLYRVYAAKRTGKKKSDLPCLANEQYVEKTKISFFCLEKKQRVMMEINPEQAPRRMSKGSVKNSKSTIKMDFDLNIDGKSIRNKEILPAKQGVGCFCWSSNRK